MLKRIIKPLSQSGQTIPELNSGKNNLYIDMRALNIIHIGMMVCLYFYDTLYTWEKLPKSGKFYKSKKKKNHEGSEYNPYWNDSLSLFLWHMLYTCNMPMFWNLSVIYLYIEAISLKLKLKVCQNKKDILLQLLHTFTLANVDAAEHRTLTNRLKRVKIFCRWQVATNVYIVNPAPPLSYHQMILATVSTENKEKTRGWVLGAWHFYRQHQVEMEWRKT